MSQGREDAKNKEKDTRGGKGSCKSNKKKFLELEPAQADASQISEPQQQPEKVRET